MKKLIIVLILLMNGHILNAQNTTKLSKSDSLELEKLKQYDKDFIQYKRLAFNTESAEYAPSYYSNGIVYSKSKSRLTDFGGDVKVKKKHKSKLYFSSLDVDFNKSAKLKINGKNKLGVAQASFHNPSKTVYYTALGSTNGTVLNKNHFGVYSAKYNLTDNVWASFNTFPYNGTFYSTVTPCINKAGDKLYFSANKHEGFGGMDIYVSEWKNNEWTEPVNVGKGVNTAGDELYPFIFEDSILYFASNGRLGLGGLDVYQYNMNSRKTTNLGAPINSAYDDFGLIRIAKVNNGFFSSNRTDEGKNTDIYSYKSIRPKPREIEINVLDNATNKLIEDVKINVSCCLSKEIDLFRLMDGKLTGMKFEIGENYKILVVKPGYITKTVNVVFKKTDKEFFILLDKDSTVDSTKLVEEPNYIIKNNTFKAKVKAFVAEKFKKSEEKPINQNQYNSYSSDNYNTLNTIYFDLNKYQLKPESIALLDELAYVLKEQKKLRVSIYSYTDSRGTQEYNLKLSQKRANATAKYLIKNGVSKHRVRAIGRGEQKPIVKCGKNCTEADHAVNRRTEIILK